jgi:hypothetical protein
MKQDQVVAALGLSVKSPWVVHESEDYPGRFYFFNLQTHESAWSLDSAYISATDASLTLTVVDQSKLPSEGLLQDSLTKYSNDVFSHLSSGKDSNPEAQLLMNATANTSSSAEARAARLGRFALSSTNISTVSDLPVVQATLPVKQIEHAISGATQVMVNNESLFIPSQSLSSTHLPSDLNHSFVSSSAAAERAARLGRFALTSSNISTVYESPAQRSPIQPDIRISHANPGVDQLNIGASYGAPLASSHQPLPSPLVQLDAVQNVGSSAAARAARLSRLAVSPTKLSMVTNSTAVEMKQLLELSLNSNTSVAHLEGGANQEFPIPPSVLHPSMDLTSDVGSLTAARAARLGRFAKSPSKFPTVTNSPTSEAALLEVASFDTATEFVDFKSEAIQESPKNMSTMHPLTDSASNAGSLTAARAARLGRFAVSPTNIPAMTRESDYNSLQSTYLLTNSSKLFGPPLQAAASLSLPRKLPDSTITASVGLGRSPGSSETASALRAARLRSAPAGEFLGTSI